MPGTPPGLKEYQDHAQDDAQDDAQDHAQDDDVGQRAGVHCQGRAVYAVSAEDEDPSVTKTSPP